MSAHIRTASGAHIGLRFNPLRDVMRLS